MRWRRGSRVLAVGAVAVSLALVAAACTPKPPPPPPKTNACALDAAVPAGALSVADAEAAAVDAVAAAEADPELLDDHGDVPLLIAEETDAGDTELTRYAAEDSLDARRAARDAARAGKVVAVEVDQPVYALEPFPPDDQYFESEQWGLKPARSTHGAAWAHATGDGVVIAVVDTGVQANHPDLAGQVLPGVTYFGGANPQVDWQGHGTHVAGIAAAATNNGIGVAGAAPGARILPGQALNADGVGSVTTLKVVLDWIINKGGAPRADVINMSLGMRAPSSLIQQSVQDAWNAGIPMVAAAGNHGELTTPGYAPGVQCAWPAGYPHTIAVASLAWDGTRSTFSNRGTFLDVIAPGGGNFADLTKGYILSTYRNPSTGVLTYGYARGTSMAAPQVAAAVAMLMEVCPDRSSDFYLQRIRATAIDIPPAGKDISHGYGLVNPLGAVTAGC